MKKTETKSTVLLQHHLKALKLPTVQRECETVASRCATGNVDHLAFLLQLCELELIDRKRRLKAAKFPMYKTLDTFDFEAQSSLNKVLFDVMSTVHRHCHHEPAVRKWTEVLGSERLTGATLDRLYCPLLSVRQVVSMCERSFSI